MSIYIHIPFCNSICSYCDFCKVYYNKKYIYDYLDNLKKEISSRYKGEKVNTIFIGGGTPSSLDIDELRYLFDIVGVFDKIFTVNLLWNVILILLVKKNLLL